jgi:tetratricopeptide (TPR) repeat protein
VAGTQDQSEEPIERARICLSSGRFGEAERLCLQALERNPNQTTALAILGQSLLAQSRLHEAEMAFRRATLIQPENPSFHFQLGVLKQANGQLSEAIGHVEQAVCLAPNLPQPHAKLGQLMVLLGEPERAIPHLRKALSLDPTFPPALKFLSHALLETGQIAEAEGTLRELARLAPNDAEVSQMRGRANQQRGEFEEAARAFEEAIRLDPEGSAAYVALTYSRKTLDKHLPLRKRMAEMVQGPGLPAADRTLLHYSLGKAHDDLGEYEEAMKHFEEANRLSLVEREHAGVRFDRLVYRDAVERLADFCADLEPVELGVIPSQSERPILIVGMVRSGTTLVDQILGAHPDVATGGELAFWLERVPSWPTAVSALLPRLLTQSVAEYQELLDRISPKANRVTDKMPMNYQVLGGILKAFPRARVVHCRRNPVDTCISVFVTPYLKSPEFAHDRGNIVFAYREYQRLMSRWSLEFPAARFLEVEYERLVQDSEAVTRELISFAGLEWDDRCLNPQSDHGVVNTPSQWQVRQPIYRASIERWRNYEPWLGEFAQLLPERMLPELKP